MNLDRHRNLELGLQVQMDGTARIMWQGFPLTFLGVVDVGQHYHNVASAVVKSESNEHMKKVIVDTFMYANIAMEILGKEPLKPKFGNSDNCDAIQNAYLELDALPINCKVHMSRSTKTGNLEVPDPENMPRKCALSVMLKS